MRIFIVVAKNRPDLYQYFVAGFEGVEGIEVILDRRLGVATEAQGDRRRARDIYDELQTRGFVIVRLPS